ncbi:MAG: hypothetical protein CK519_03350 [Opitutia bacterium]|nr:MAG: hypothetical protein CK519_03350 [Opitutae bacterium]
MPQAKFFLAAATLLGTTAFINAATIFPTSPLIQIGDDTDIFFTTSLSFDVKDNLYSVAAKKSAALVTFTPGFDLQYAKDSPLSANMKVSQSFLRYNKSEYKDLEEGQTNISVGANYETGGPLTVGVSTSYNESARNDNLAGILGADSGQVLGATLVRQANYAHTLNVGYRLSEKLRLSVGFTNSYNHYLNPVKTKTTTATSPLGTPGTSFEDIAYNTNTLSEINTKSIPISINYKTPSEKLEYGLKFQHDLSNYSAAPYFRTSQKKLPLPVGTVDSVPRPPGQQKFTKNFIGLTVNGKPTSSGKINITTNLGYFTSDLDGVSDNGLSYNLTFAHNLTEKFTHELNLIHDLSASAAGGSTKNDTIGYTASYALLEKVALSFHALKSKVVSGTTQVDSLDFNAGVNWEYNKYIRFAATIDTLDSKVKNSPASNFKANSINFSTTFRY